MEHELIRVQNSDNLESNQNDFIPWYTQYHDQARHGKSKPSSALEDSPLELCLETQNPDGSEVDGIMQCGSNN